MNTKHFDYMIAVAETKNLSQAARRLGISQPVLSRHIAGMEKDLGVQLFVRQKRQLYITNAGQIYLNGVRRMKELQTQMVRSLDYLLGVDELHLHIGMSPYRGGQELAAFYPDLLSRYPNLNLQVTEGNTKVLLDKLYQKELSLIINLYHPGWMPYTKAATFIKTEILIAIPEYSILAGNTDDFPPPFARLSPVQLRKLTDIPFVFLDGTTLIGQMVDEACRHYQFNPQVLLRTSNAIAVSTLLTAGSYGGFVLENTMETQTHIRYFRFPHPLYVYSGMIFTENHQPTPAESYLYQLEYRQARAATPHLLFQNDFGRLLYNDVTGGREGSF